MRALQRRHGVTANLWRHFPRLIDVDPVAAHAAGAGAARRGPARRPDDLPAGVRPPRRRRGPRARPRAGRYATDSLSTRTIRRISLHFEHRLFLSATPHNGYTNSFTSLLELLDPSASPAT
ncbi:MAG: hypothetical protein U0U69_12610 [Acidimicrobiia bacterium]